MAVLPLHQAVIQRDERATVHLCRDFHYLCQLDEWGYSALELAQFLDWRPGVELLGGETKHRLHVGLESPATKMDFQSLYRVRYLPQLKFGSYKQWVSVLKHCPLLLQHTPLGREHRQLGAALQDLIRRGALARVEVKSTDSTMGLGLFAREELNPGSFIGEYTGLVRPHEPEGPPLNPYCVHYPTKWWSRDLHVIDASQEGNLMRFINHSQSPNCEGRWVLDRRLLHLVILTQKPVAAGTQLFLDYGQDYWLQRQALISPLP